MTEQRMASSDIEFSKATPLEKVVSCELDALHPRKANHLLSSPPSYNDIMACLSKDGPIIIHLSELTDKCRSKLSRHGLSEHLLVTSAIDDRYKEAELISAFDPAFHREALSFTNEEWSLFAKSFIRDACYVDTIFRCGGMLIRDPFTGKAIRSSHSFLIDDYHIAFRFSSFECFYIIVGQTYGHRIAFVVPGLRLVIIFPQVQPSAALLAWIVKCCERLVGLLVSESDRVFKVLASPTEEAGVQIGFRQNLGHFVWQELQGISDIIDSNGAAAIRHIVLGPYRPFDPRDVFPELANVSVTEVEDPKEPFGTTLGLPYQFVRPVGLRIKEQLRRRIDSVVGGKVSKEIQVLISRKAATRFLIWINLRSHNKAWRRQSSGTVDVINRLSKVIPDISVVFDGFSDTSSIAVEIAASLESGVEVIDTIGCSLEESLIWARSIHVYSAVVGSGLIINSWLSSKPGVAHANSAHLRQASFWPLVSEGTIPPVFLPQSTVEDDGSMYGPYDFDPDTLYNAILSLAREYYPERMRDA